MKWIIWALLLLAQNASFTFVSRARNSGSLGYHAVAGAISNAVWFASQFILVGSVVDLLKTGTLLQAVGVGLFYTACTLGGSLGSHYVAMRWVERGRRSVPR